MTGIARLGLSRFALALLGATAAAHLGFFGAAHELFSRLGVGWPSLPAAGLALLGVALFAFRLLEGLEDRRRSPVRLALFDIPYFVHWCACVFTLIPDLLYVIVRPLVGLASGGALLPGGFFLGLHAFALVVCGYGVLVRRRFFQVEDVEVRIEGLPDSFEGFTIAHLSDLHIGPFTPESWGHRWARAANALRPDLTVLTGDYVTSGTAFHEDIARVVGALRAREGVVVSMGNHDYFGSGEPLMTLMKDAGADVMRNRGRVLSRGGKSVYLAAIDDSWTRRADLGAALSERPEGMPCVLLAHDPKAVPAAAERGVDLVLSGHTHGGQIAFPFLARRLSLGSLAHPFNLGVYRDGKSTLYVHPGLGTTGPPMRLGAAPAVVRITLRAA